VAERTTAEAETSPEGRLYAAGFTRRLEFWVTPDGERVLNLEDAVAALDAGDLEPASIAWSEPDVERFPGCRPRTDDEIDELLRPSFPTAPPWLEPLAELVVEKLKPTIHAEVRAALKASAGRLGTEPES
jgi:hypothetical protein